MYETITLKRKHLNIGMSLSSPKCLGTSPRICRDAIRTPKATPKLKKDPPNPRHLTKSTVK